MKLENIGLVKKTSFGEYQRKEGLITKIALDLLHKCEDENLKICDVNKILSIVRDMMYSDVKINLSQ